MKLFQTFTFPNGKTVKNRFFKSAMSEQMVQGNTPSNASNGMYAELYGIWAKGGAGMLVTGNVMVDYTALGSAADIVIEDECDLAELKRWAAAGQNTAAGLFCVESFVQNAVAKRRKRVPPRTRLIGKTV